MLGKCCQLVVLSTLRVDSVDHSSFLLCPAMGYGIWVNYIRRNLIVEADEVQIVRRYFNRVVAPFSSHLVWEKMSYCPIEIVFHLSI